jgi:chromosome partitioning protein
VKPDRGMQDWKLLSARPGASGRGRIVSIANQKGGVGKTTTSINLATGLALRGHRVLIVDVDPQSNATTGLGIDHRALELSSYDLLLDGARVDDVVVRTAIDRLDCAPASVDLAGAEVELVEAPRRERRLAEALAAAGDEYEVIVLDCPPSLGLLTLNALAAAEDLIIPVQCEYYALEGLGQLLGTAERVRRSLNPDLRIVGFLLTMYDARTKLAGQVAEEVRKHFGDLVFETIIPRSVRLSEAPSFGEPVLTLDPSARGSVAYRLLAAEFESRYGLQTHPPPPPREVTITLDEPQGAAVPGPGGRGYGTQTAEPPDLDTAWPRPAPW